MSRSTNNRDRSPAGNGLHTIAARVPLRPEIPSTAEKVSGSGHKPVLPGVGAELFGFRLRGELGRGAFAAVFLAEEADLASRPVVLKISSAEGDEPQTLAQLQHTHIVPIYSVHEDAASRLRAVCMPYFGGASLSQVLQRLFQATSHPAQGVQLVHALEAVSSPAVGPAPTASGSSEGPDATPLANRITSGVTPNVSAANGRPVRPIPHWTSSKTRSMPWWSHRSRRPRNHSTGGTT